MEELGEEAATDADEDDEIHPGRRGRRSHPFIHDESGVPRYRVFVICPDTKVETTLTTVSLESMTLSAR